MNAVVFPMLYAEYFPSQPWHRLWASLAAWTRWKTGFQHWRPKRAELEFGIRYYLMLWRWWQSRHPTEVPQWSPERRRCQSWPGDDTIQVRYTDLLHYTECGGHLSQLTIPRFRAAGQGRSAMMAVQRLTLPLQMPPTTRNNRNMLKFLETAQTA